MSEIEELVGRIHKAAELNGVKPSTMSRKLFGGGARLSELEAGKTSLTIATLERVKAEIASLGA